MTILSVSALASCKNSKTPQMASVSLADFAWKALVRPGRATGAEYRQRELWRLPVELIGVGETALC